MSQISRRSLLKTGVAAGVLPPPAYHFAHRQKEEANFASALLVQTLPIAGNGPYPFG